MPKSSLKCLKVLSPCSWLTSQGRGAEKLGGGAIAELPLLHLDCIRLLFLLASLQLISSWDDEEWFSFDRAYLGLLQKTSQLAQNLHLEDIFVQGLTHEQSKLMFLSFTNVLKNCYYKWINHCNIKCLVKINYFCLTNDFWNSLNYVVHE